VGSTCNAQLSINDPVDILEDSSNNEVIIVLLVITSLITSIDSYYNSADLLNEAGGF
jgi:hypothetical protein